MFSFSGDYKTRTYYYYGNKCSFCYDFFKFPDSSQIGFVELDFSTFLKIKNRYKETKVFEYDTLSDQIVRKDLSFVIDKWVSYDVVVDAVSKVEEIKDVRVFDLYCGENLPKDKKSISLSIKIKWEKLTSEDINKIMKKAIEEVEKVGGKLRQ